LETRDGDLRKLRELLYQNSGIRMGVEKNSLLLSRLGKRLKALGLRSFRQYYRLVSEEKEGSELERLVDCLTTNKTSFFREPRHFEHFAKTALPLLAEKQPKHRGPIRVWSAACSSGEEVYSLAMTMLETLEKGSAHKILGTDISPTMIGRAMEGWYEKEKTEPIPAGWADRYLVREERKGAAGYRVGRFLRQSVFFGLLNLNGEELPFRNPLDVIFCRNVMIYFDKPTQEVLIRRLTAVLKPGGFLYTGLSESLLGIRHSLRTVEPSVYQKPGLLNEG
jgi:chemotaxis protein methyltransferase CheR